MERLIETLRKAEYCVVFTGAGVSTLSGIQDFRGKDGLYKEKDSDKLFDINWFDRDPSYYYDWARGAIYNLSEREPNIIHKQIARMEKEGVVKSVITQNIDLLHQKGGSKDVIEIHGTPLTHSCRSCGRKTTFEKIVDQLKTKNIPKCKKCGGIMKPDITFFGESLPPKALQKAIEESRKADLMIILGTSLWVQPAAGIPINTLQAGGQIIIANNMKTPLDDQALLLYQDLEELFIYINENL
ncbi:MAG: NAD-dependent protein deacylase [Spirochaetales bacterium]|nr:NAD-dependent protein deacylase [Spirochaetales bacterium]